MFLLFLLFCRLLALNERMDGEDRHRCVKKESKRKRASQHIGRLLMGGLASFFPLLFPLLCSGLLINDPPDKGSISSGGVHFELVKQKQKLISAEQNNRILLDSVSILYRFELFYDCLMGLSIFPSVFVALLSVFLYRFYWRYYDATPCSKDSPICIDGDYTFVEACKLFSTDYTEAREKFSNAVKRYNSTCYHHEESDDVNDAAAGKVELLSYPILPSLTIDIAVLPGNTQELGTIVHSSGTHGVEGYAGSSIQLALVELLSSSSCENFEEEQRRRPTIVMVHAVNPVGMNEYRRFNENNVDLNRNGIITVSNSDDDDSNDDSNSDSDSENVYSSFDDFLAKRDPNFAGYDDFHYLFAPDFEKDDYGDHGNLSLYETTLGYYAKAIPALAQHGMKALKRTMVAGKSILDRFVVASSGMKPRSC